MCLYGFPMPSKYRTPSTYIPLIARNMISGGMRPPTWHRVFHIHEWPSTQPGSLHTALQRKYTQPCSLFSRGTAVWTMGGTAVWTLGHGCVQVPGCVQGHPWYMAVNDNTQVAKSVPVLEKKLICKKKANFYMVAVNQSWLTNKYITR